MEGLSLERFSAEKAMKSNQSARRRYASQISRTGEESESVAAILDLATVMSQANEMIYCKRILEFLE